ncbi:MAG: DEAD/DEAH box helicase family protein, partial [Desulfobacterales bacterium]|nr:DEAD/DEAH box helicase family protein [Desulfobacterales bacterium]
MNQELHAFISPNGSLLLEWIDTEEPVSKSTQLLQQEIFYQFQTNSDSWLLFLGFCDKKVSISQSLDFWRNVSCFFIRKLSQTPDLEILRDQINIEIDEVESNSFLDDIPIMTGAEYLNKDLFVNIWLSLNIAYKKGIKDYAGTVEEFIKSYNPDIHLVGRIFFHLVENKTGDEPFAFLATYSTRLNEQGKSKHVPLRFALQEYASDQPKLLELLTTVHIAAAESRLISNLIETGELFHPLAWSSKEAFTFLSEIPIYENAGILCRIPNWWKGASASSRLNISIGNSQPAFVGLNALLDFNIQLMIGDIEITEQEARELIQKSEGLAFIKNKWVAVDSEKLRQTLEAFENVRKNIGHDGFSIRDALRMQLQPEKLFEDQTESVDKTVSQGQWLQSVMYKLRHPEQTSTVQPGDGFQADLREYQKKGLNWLYFLHSLRFGACLADDMGLGKTIQLLGFLSVVKSEHKNPASLLIIPASLISNWANEIGKFLPNLKYFVAHPDGDLKKNATIPEKTDLNQYDLVITTYALVQRYEWLQAYSWNYVILDEAQAIKNPGTKQTRIIKKLYAQNRIVMTGTPIENRLSDLWSLFDFLNPGLLGNKNEFGE